MSEAYEDEVFCQNCGKETPHRCEDSGHERDSSGDYQECLACGWWLTGYGGVQSPPLQEM